MSHYKRIRDYDEIHSLYELSNESRVQLTKLNIQIEEIVRDICPSVMSLEDALFNKQGNDQ